MKFLKVLSLLIILSINTGAMESEQADLPAKPVEQRVTESKKTKKRRSKTTKKIQQELWRANTLDLQVNLATLPALSHIEKVIQEELLPQALQETTKHIAELKNKYTENAHDLLLNQLSVWQERKGSLHYLKEQYALIVRHLLVVTLQDHMMGEIGKIWTKDSSSNNQVSWNHLNKNEKEERISKMILQLLFR